MCGEEAPEHNSSNKHGGDDAKTSAPSVRLVKERNQEEELCNHRGDSRTEEFEVNDFSNLGRRLKKTGVSQS